MYFFYINDSSDPYLHTFSALGVPKDNLQTLQAVIRNYRLQLKQNAGIFIIKELDAAKFVAGRGHPSNRKLNKRRRCRIFNKALSFLGSQKENGVILLSTALENQSLAFQNLLYGINQLMQSCDDSAVLICDEIKKREYARLMKKIQLLVINKQTEIDYDDIEPEPTEQPANRILEDLIFKPAHRSNLIQLSGFCAYALLRKVNQLESKHQFGIDTAFDALEPICTNSIKKY